MLAMLGSVNDEILNKDELAMEMLKLLQRRYPEVLANRYGIEDAGEQKAFAMLQQIARIRACLMKGGELDLAKAAGILIDDFRSGRLGRLTLEVPAGKAG